MFSQLLSSLLPDGALDTLAPAPPPVLVSPRALPRSTEPPADPFAARVAAFHVSLAASPHDGAGVLAARRELDDIAALLQGGELGGFGVGAPPARRLGVELHHHLRRHDVVGDPQL